MSHIRKFYCELIRLNMKGVCSYFYKRAQISDILLLQNQAPLAVVDSGIQRSEIPAKLQQQSSGQKHCHRRRQYSADSNHNSQKRISIDIVAQKKDSASNDAAAQQPKRAVSPNEFRNVKEIFFQRIHCIFLFITGGFYIALPLTSTDSFLCPKNNLASA
ncbi:MAG: hypothetical protein AAFX54_07785 [Pseudomonadota bacterium]